MKNKYLLLSICVIIMTHGYAQNYNTYYGYYTAPGGNGSYNSLYGYNSGHSIVSGSTMNTAVGFGSLYSNTTGSYNSAIGSYALYNNVVGGGNVAHGHRALIANTASNNTAIGHQSLVYNTTGLNNTGIGFEALLNNTTGNYNTALGLQAMYSNSSGNYNTAIGYQADISNSSATNATAIGYGAQATGSNTIQLGNSSVTQIFAGTGTNATLVTGGLKITGLASLRASTASQGLIISNCDVGGFQTQLGFTTADQSKIGLAKESYFNFYNDGKWNLNSANTTGGTTLPISLNTDNVSRLYIQANGNVGIGATSPSSKLTLQNSASGLNSGILLVDGGNNQRGAVYYDGGQNLVIDALSGPGGTDVSTFKIRTGANDRLSITRDGNIGIGTAIPDYKLTVNGTIHSTEVKVTATVPAPDYVFEKEYDLLPLDEVKSYIEQNKHLPEVPSAKDIEKNGIQLSEMSLLLLKKVEELTLHLIDLKNENEKLKSRIEIIENRK